MQALSFGSPLGPWIQFALVASILVVAGVVLARRLGPKAVAALAALAVLFAWFVTGRSFHLAVTTDQEVALRYAVPPRTVRLPAGTIAGASWRPGWKGTWTLEVATRAGRRYSSQAVRRDRMEALEPAIIRGPLGVSRWQWTGCFISCSGVASHGRMRISRAAAARGLLSGPKQPSRKVQISRD